MGCRNVGRMKFRGVSECSYGCVIAHDEIEYMRQESRIGSCTSQGFRSDAAFGQERAKPLGVSRDKGKRLNCNDFSCFPGISRGFSQGAYLPFRGLWFLFSEQSCPSLRNVFKQLATTCWKWRLGLTG